MKKVLALVVAALMLASLMAGTVLAEEPAAEGGEVAVSEWEIPVLSARRTDLYDVVWKKGSCRESGKTPVITEPLHG